MKSYIIGFERNGLLGSKVFVKKFASMEEAVFFAELLLFVRYGIGMTPTFVEPDLCCFETTSGLVITVAQIEKEDEEIKEKFGKIGISLVYLNNGEIPKDLLG